LKCARALVAAGANVNAHFRFNELHGSYLEMAAHQGDLDMVKYLLEECGPHVAMTTENGPFGCGLSAAAVGVRTRVANYLASCRSFII